MMNQVSKFRHRTEYKQLTRILPNNSPPRMPGKRLSLRLLSIFQLGTEGDKKGP